MNQSALHSDTTGTATLHKQWPALALMLLVATAYWPGRGGGFVFDDFPNIVDNTQLHVATLLWRDWIAAIFSSDAGTLQRPLAMLTFAINHYFTGLDPVPMKLTNIAIHALNATLVLMLVRTLLQMAGDGFDGRRREWAARFTAAAWALHPINLMAVLFVVQRMESLSHTFVFAGLWLYLLGRQHQLDGRRGWALILPGLFGGTLLGTMSKESAVLLPLYAFLAELCLPALRSSGSRRKLWLLFAVILFAPALLGAAWLLPKVTAAGAYANRDYTLIERLLTEGRVVIDYLYWSLVPSLRELSLYHDDYLVSRGWWSPPSTLLSLLGLLLLAGLAWWLRGRRPLAALGLLWFLAAQLLTATVIPLELVYEHRNYFASLGICLVLADLLLLAPAHESQRRIGALLAMLALAAFAMTTHLRAREWSDPYRFAATEAAKHPQSPRATYAYARILVLMTGYRADSTLLAPAHEALERARAAPRSGILAHSAFLVLAANTGMPQQDEWWLDMQSRLRQRPVGPQETNALGTLTRCAREQHCSFPRDRMIATFEAALSRKPNAEVFNIYGDYVLNVMRQPDTALHLWHRALALKPKVAQYRINLIKVLIALGRFDEAKEQIGLLRRMGSFGQYQSAAFALEARMRNRQSAPTDSSR